jgi:cbb3-type cytochrome oxidase subunit 3
MEGPMPRLRAYGYAWITTAFFLLSLAGHWIFGWYAYVNAQEEHQAPVKVADYLVEMGRDMLENWQSEFLQLLWQVGGLAILLYVGSPQSKEGDERQEAKLDAILRRVAPEQAEAIIADLDMKYQRKP